MRSYSIYESTEIPGKFFVLSVRGDVVHAQKVKAMNGVSQKSINRLLRLGAERNGMKSEEPLKGFMMLIIPEKKQEIELLESFRSTV